WFQAATLKALVAACCLLFGHRARIREKRAREARAEVEPAGYRRDRLAVCAPRDGPHAPVARFRPHLQPAATMCGELLDASDADQPDDVVEVGAKNVLLLLRRRPEHGPADDAFLPRHTVNADERNEEDARELGAHPRRLPLLLLGVGERESAHV